MMSRNSDMKQESGTGSRGPQFSLLCPGSRGYPTPPLSRERTESQLPCLRPPPLQIIRSSIYAISLREGAILERSLRGSLESLSFLLWDITALFRFFGDLGHIPKGDPLFDQFQRSISKVSENIASAISSSAAFMTLKRRELTSLNVVPSVTEAQKRKLLLDPLFNTRDLFSTSSLDAARQAARDVSLYKPHLQPKPSISPVDSQKRPWSSGFKPQSKPSSSSAPPQCSSSPRFKKNPQVFKKSSDPQRQGGFSEIGILSLAESRRLPGPVLASVGGSGSGCLGRGGSAQGLYDSLCQSASSVRPSSLSLPAYFPSSIRGTALFQEFQDLLRKGAIELAPPTPGFYSSLFVVQKDSGTWRPIIDLSTLNMYVAESRFHMETPQSVLRSIR